MSNKLLFQSPIPQYSELISSLVLSEIIRPLLSYGETLAPLGNDLLEDAHRALCDFLRTLFHTKKKKLKHDFHNNI